MTLEPGLEASVSRVVAEADTASSLGSGDVDVLGTPAVVALCEAAAVRAVSETLEESHTTVGVRIDLEHLAPTSLGRAVTARAELATVDGRTLGFVVEAADDAGVIARGSHTRVVVDRTRFLEAARSR
jgi:predicted thioesterase